MSKTLSVSIAIVSFILGVGFGYTLIPEYSAYSINPKHGEGLGKPDKYFDLRFINGMIAHHKSAIYILEQVQKESQKTELHDLAKIVIELDTQGISQLYDLKKELYNDNRDVKNFTKTELGSADKNFDLRFLNAMIIHHEEAITSSKEVLGKSTNKKILEIAGEVSLLLSENLKQLKIWREEWYNVK